MESKTYIIVQPGKFIAYMNNFAHALEYYYGCLDELLVQPNPNYIVGIYDGMRQGRVFINDFLSAVQRQFPNISVSEDNNLTKPIDKTIGCKEWKRTYKSVEAKIIKSKADGISYEERVNVQITDWMTPIGARILRTALLSADSFREKPTIGIINRRSSSGRHLVNSGEIAEKIRERHGLTVEETFFEDKDCLFQLWFNNKHDIIIAPHGANLSSTPFIQDYGLVIECANPEWIPYNFFPGLSLSSGKSHCVVCNDHPYPAWSNEKLGSKTHRLKSDVHVSPDVVCEAVKDFMEYRISNHKDSTPHNVKLEFR